MTEDFNIAPDHVNDTSGYLHMNNTNTRRLLHSRMALNNLTNIWQDLNHRRKEDVFDKWQKKNWTRARLDFFLISKNSIELITGIKIGRSR